MRSNCLLLHIANIPLADGSLHRSMHTPHDASHGQAHNFSLFEHWLSVPVREKKENTTIVLMMPRPKQIKNTELCNSTAIPGV